MRHRRRSYRGYGDDPDPIGETLADVNDRLDDLALQIERFVRRSPSADPYAPTSLDEQRDDPKRLGEALAELNRRLDQIEKFERIDARPANGLPRNDTPHARSEWLPAFDHAVPAPASAAAVPPTAPVSVECTQDLSGLENHLRQITAQIASLNKPCQIDDAVIGLRKDLAEIGRALNNAMPRHAIETLEKEIRALSERVDRSRESGANSPKLAQLEYALVELRDTLHNLKPAENLVEVNEAVKNLARKVDQIASTSQNPAALQKLDQVIAGLRSIVSHVASNDAVGKLTVEVHNLSARIDQATPQSNAEAISNLDQRITSLIGAGHSPSPELAMQIKALDEKFDQRIAALIGAKESSTPEVATHIQALGEHIDQRIDTLIGANQSGAPEVAAHIQALGERLDRRIDTLIGANQSGAPEVAAHIQALGEHIDRRIDTLIGANQSGAPEVAAHIQALGEHIDNRMDTLVGAGQSASPEVAEQIKILADRLDQRINALMAATPSSSPDVAAQIRALGEKLEAIRLPQGNAVALGSIEDRLAKLAGKLDGSDALLRRLDAIERGMADLLVYLEDARKSVPPEPQQAPPETRNEFHIEQSALPREETHTARHEDTTPTAPALPNIETTIDAPAQPAIADPMPMAEERLPEPTTAAAPPPEPQTELAAASASAPTYAAVLDPNAAATRRRPIDPSLPPDTPIEPNLEASHVRASATERITASEAALGTPKPAGREVASQFETLIAARRAAFQASTEAGTAAEFKSSISQKPASQVGKRMRTYLRWGLLFASLIIIVLGALKVGFDMWGSETADPPPAMTGQPDAGSGAPPEASRPPAPTPAPGQGLDTTRKAPAMPPPGPEPAPTTPLDDLPSTPPANGSSGDDPIGDVISKPMPDVTGTLPRPGQDPVRAPTEPGLPASIGGTVLRAAALAGNPAAEYEIATRYAEGRGVTANIEESARWLERAARSGFAPALFRLGGLYDKGGALKRDRNLARQLYTAAAEKGHAKAMHNLAVLYAEGIDGKPNYKMAAQWFRRAAEYGIADSQYNLAILYIRGIGLEQNLVESYKWFSLAAAQGDQEAVKKREEVAERLDEQSLTAAHQAVQAFVIAQQPDQAVSLRTPPGGWDRMNAGSQPGPSRPRPSATPAPNSLLSPAPL